MVGVELRGKLRRNGRGEIMGGIISPTAKGHSRDADYGGKEEGWKGSNSEKNFPAVVGVAMMAAV